MNQSSELPPAIESIQGANPFVGMTPRHLTAAAGRWALASSLHPLLTTSECLRWVGEEIKVLAGLSEVEPDARDKRFGHPAWDDPVWGRLKKGYLVAGRSLLHSTEQVGLDVK